MQSREIKQLLCQPNLHDKLKTGNVHFVSRTVVEVFELIQIVIHWLDRTSWFASREARFLSCLKLLLRNQVETAFHKVGKFSF